MLTAKVQGHEPITATFQWLLVTQSGAVVTVAAPTTRDFSGAGAVSRVVTTGNNSPVQFFGRNLEAGTVFLMVFDLAAVPANGATPDYSPLELLAGQSFSLTVPPELFLAGLVWAISTTDTTLTISVGAGATVTTWFRVP